MNWPDSGPALIYDFGRRVYVFNDVLCYELLVCYIQSFCVIYRRLDINLVSAGGTRRAITHLQKDHNAKNKQSPRESASVPRLSNDSTGKQTPTQNLLTRRANVKKKATSTKGEKERKARKARPEDQEPMTENDNEDDEDESEASQSLRRPRQ